MLTMSAHRRYATADSAVSKKKPAFITNRGKPGLKLNVPSIRREWR
jgi:hypothetical protein